MTKKIKKILIANRGEIAVRVMKTCREMGIGSVAVYSDADRKALHVRMADEAVHIGASPAAESYLVIDKIIAACKSSGADAVHPGYGFLSENPEFTRRLKKEGITFIGPSPESMEAMGLKDAAKKLMEKAGVPVTPGYHGKDQDTKLLKAKAGMIGYPVLIKAIAGGGGKGMRKVDTEGDFTDALASCQREAKSAFGDDRVLIEKYILSPRHIEVQIFGDSHGNVVHMFERDCSLQRRHQKVIEEAPAPGMTDAVRKAMTDAAIEAAQAVNYVGAGTVEFIVDGSGSLRKDGFWFMEMNTRLQVEHPVTEMITGLDLVELQIRVAQGEKLPKQTDIKMKGHAVEARLYAEDPLNNFFPSTGWIHHLNHEGEWDRQTRTRIDTGYNHDAYVGIYYDPLIAKIIGHGEDRPSAINQVHIGLRAIHVYPLTTNAHTLFACIDHDAFWKERINTNFFSDFEDDLKPYDIRQDDRAYGILALKIIANQSGCNQDCMNGSLEGFGLRDGWRINLDRKPIYRFKRGDSVCYVEIKARHHDFANVVVDGTPYTFYFEDVPAGGSFENQLNNYNPWYFADCGNYYLLEYKSAVFIFNNADYCDKTSFNNPSGNILTAPMPGKIIAVNVAVGDAVKACDKLVIMEAMKMEMSLEAPRDGVVASVTCEAGALVTDGEMLLELEEET